MPYTVFREAPLNWGKHWYLGVKLIITCPPFNSGALLTLSVFYDVLSWDKKWFLRIIMIAHFSEECKFHSYSSLERAVRDCSVDLVDWRSRKELPPIIDMYRFLSTLFPLVTSLILRLP